jgi:hypothetical protein
VNYNTASEAYHEGTTTWFFESCIFEEWELIGSLLWIHGKRAFLLAFISQLLMDFCSGCGKEHPVVRQFRNIPVARNSH